MTDMPRDKWSSEFKSKTTAVLLIASLTTSLLCGWGTIHFITLLTYLGFPGAIVMVMIVGVHGADNNMVRVIGSVFYVIANTITYYFIFRFCARRLPSSSVE